MAFADSVSTYTLTHLQEAEVIGNRTIVNLQGVPDQKFIIKLQLGPKPKRRNLVAASHPQSPEENLQRLAEAGFLMEAFTAYCTNCRSKGHITRACPEEKRQVELKDETVLKTREITEGMWKGLTLSEVEAGPLGGEAGVREAASNGADW